MLKEWLGLIMAILSCPFVLMLIGSVILVAIMVG